MAEQQPAKRVKVSLSATQKLHILEHGLKQNLGHQALADWYNTTIGSKLTPKHVLSESTIRTWRALCVLFTIKWHFIIKFAAFGDLE